MRDENGFKCHVASESHVRNMQLIGENPNKAINEFSQQFKRDFLQLLRTGHGEKKVNLNQFYQEYIANKEHVHMNATKWASLTEFAKYLGRDGICRVEEDEKNNERGGASGLTISWIDNSPEALRRQDALRKKERQDRGDEEREQKAIQQQIRKAQLEVKDEAELESDLEEDSDPGLKTIHQKGKKVVLNLGAKREPQLPTPPRTDGSDSPSISLSPPKSTDVTEGRNFTESAEAKQTSTPSAQAPVKAFSFGAVKPKNVFATGPKKNLLGSEKKVGVVAQIKPLSNAERIMKEETERKRQQEMNKGPGFKRQKVF